MAIGLETARHEWEDALRRVESERADPTRYGRLLAQIEVVTDELRRRGGQGEWLTLGQAARFLGVAQSTIRKWSDQGRVPAFYTPGGHRRYRRADLQRFLERSGPGGSASTGPLILLVDDDERVRELVRVNLEF